MPRNKYPEHTVQKILDASEKLFFEKGFEKTTILDIVANLDGLTRGAFYHHFKSKEEVLNALSDKLFFDNNPFEKVAGDASLNGLQKIKKVIKLQFENDRQMNISVMVLPMLKNPRIFTEILESNQTILVPLLQSLFDEAIQDGSIKATNAKMLAELFILLTTVWSATTIVSSTKQDVINRGIFAKNIFESIGVPILDDDFIDYCSEMAEKIEDELKK